MGYISKSASLLALAGALTLSMSVAAQARTITKPTITGIGFANSEAGAAGRAIRAWTNTARKKYGPSFAHYNKARKKSLSCDYIGGGFSSYSKRRRSSVGSEGNPNSKWTCITKARAVGKTDVYKPETRNTTGIGFGSRKWSARYKAIKAWRLAARDRYGRAFDKFTFATKKRVNCERIGFAEKSFTSRRGGRSVEVIGNPNSPWTCTAKGRPRSLLGKLF